MTFRAPMILTTEADPRVTALRAKLDIFYSSPEEYTSFEHDMQMLPDHWSVIVRELRSRVSARTCGLPIRVLEFGAGRTGFGTFIGELRSAVRFDVQDITTHNYEYLMGQADTVHICDLSEVDGPYDVILSTYAFEHICHPRESLKHLLAILAPGGAMFIAAPRYGMPLYIPPSARHYSRIKQIALSAWLAFERVAAMIDRKPRFWVHIDPAVLRVPWYRDADAVHWVSLSDFYLSVPRGYTCSRVRLRAKGWRHRFWEMFLLAYVRIDRMGRDGLTGNAGESR